MRVSSFIFLVALAGTGISAPADASGPGRDNEIAACMRTAAKALKFSGTAYARHDGLVIEQSFGSADPARQVSNTGRTRFNIGSVNKLFTAIAIGRLVDQGVLRFDAPIGRYLPRLKPAFARITIAQLLDHTSGLGDYFRPENESAIAAARTATDLLPLALATPPSFPPGTRRAYSNSGFVVLGAIIEQRSGEPWAAFMQRQILDPAGMTETRFDSTGGATPISKALVPGGPGAPKAWAEPARASPAGGLFSTPGDLSRLLTALFDGRLLSRATLAVLLTPRPDPQGGPATVAYGVLVQKTPVARIGIGGGAPGVNADVTYLPESGWQLIALANTDPPAATRLDRVLETTVTAANPRAACAEALSEANRRAPTLLMMMPPGQSSALISPPP